MQRGPITELPEGLQLLFRVAFQFKAAAQGAVRLLLVLLPELLAARHHSALELEVVAAEKLLPRNIVTVVLEVRPGILLAALLVLLVVREETVSIAIPQLQDPAEVAAGLLRRVAETVATAALPEVAAAVEGVPLTVKLLVTAGRALAVRSGYSSTRTIRRPVQAPEVTG